LIDTMQRVTYQDLVKNINDYISVQWKHHQDGVCKRLTDVNVVVREGNGWIKVGLHKAILLPMSPYLDEIEKDLPSDDLDIFLPDYSLCQLRKVTSMLYRGCSNTSPGTTMEDVQDLMNSLGVKKAMITLGLKTSVVNCRAGTDPSCAVVCNNNNPSRIGEERKDPEQIIVSSSPMSEEQQSLHYDPPFEDVDSVNHCRDMVDFNEKSPLCMDSRNIKLGSKDLETSVKSKLKTSFTPSIKREKVDVKVDLDQAMRKEKEDVENYNPNKDIEALLKDAAVLLEECPVETYEEILTPQIRRRATVSKYDIHTSAIDEDWEVMKPTIDSREFKIVPQKEMKDSGEVLRNITKLIGSWKSGYSDDDQLQDSSKQRNDNQSRIPVPNKRKSAECVNDEFGMKELVKHAARCCEDL